jgi:hypothetical protein
MAKLTAGGTVRRRPEHEFPVPGICQCIHYKL